MTLKSYFSVMNVLLYKLLFSQLGLSLEVLEIVCELRKVAITYAV